MRCKFSRGEQGKRRDRVYAIKPYIARLSEQFVLVRFLSPPPSFCSARRTRPISAAPSFFLAGSDRATSLLPPHATHFPSFPSVHLFGMATSAPSAASLTEAARSETMANDDATQLSGREAQRLAGIARQTHPAANAHQVAASQAASQRRTEEAMPAEERLRRRRQHKADVRASKRQKKELDAELHHDAVTSMDLLNELLTAEGYDDIDDEDMYAFQDWLESEGHQLRAGDEVKLTCMHMLSCTNQVHMLARAHTLCTHARAVCTRARALCTRARALCTCAHRPVHASCAHVHTPCAHVHTPCARALCTCAHTLCTRASPVHTCIALCSHVHVPCARNCVPDRRALRRVVRLG